MKKQIDQLTRRGVLKGAAATGVLAIVPRHVLGGAASPQGESAESRPAAAPARSLTWQAEEGSVALLCDGKMVWRHLHDPKMGKPCLRLALLDGTELTRPWPIPKADNPDDHPHHKALWWSWHTIDGVGVWEGNAKGTFAGNVRMDRRDDGSAVITMDVLHGAQGKPPLVVERRTIRLSAPDGAGVYTVDWQGVFAPAGDKDVVFKKTPYGGLAMRCAREMCGKDWHFFDHEGRKDVKISGQWRARWMAVTGNMAAGQQASVAIFDHPSNPRHPALWCVIKVTAYFNPAFPAAEDFTLKAHEQLTLRYGVLVAPATLDAAAVERHWKAFAESKVKDVKAE